MSHILRGLFYDHIYQIEERRKRERESATKWLRKKLNEILQYLSPIYPEGIPTSTHKKRNEMYFVSHVRSILYLFSWRICPKPITNYVDCNARCSMLNDHHCRLCLIYQSCWELVCCPYDDEI